MCTLKAGTVLKRAKQCEFWHNMSWAQVRKFWRPPTFEIEIQPKDWLMSVKEYASICDTLHECAVSVPVQLEFWTVKAKNTLEYRWNTRHLEKHYSFVSILSMKFYECLWYFRIPPESGNPWRAWPSLKLARLRPSSGHRWIEETGKPSEASANEDWWMKCDSLDTMGQYEQQVDVRMSCH